MMFGKNESKLTQKKFNDINREFEKLFSSVSGNPEKLNILIKELNKYLWLCVCWKIIKWIFACVGLIMIIYYVPLLNWNVSAIGRIFLIQLLPFWDWQYLYTAHCLIETPKIQNYVENRLNLPAERNDDDCALCESLDHIPRTMETSASFVRDEFLLKNRPVIIEESHNISERYFLERLDEIKDTLSEAPCNVKTNLRATGTVSIAHLLALASQSKGGYFLHFRNCKFDAVKASRVLWRKPIFLLLHLNPFYTSWILISEDYNIKRAKTLEVHGLIIVTQISGQLVIFLDPKYPCDIDCEQFEVKLFPGDSFLFISDLWNFSYSFEPKEIINNNFARDEEVSTTKSITFIAEFDWSITK